MVEAFFGTLFVTWLLLVLAEVVAGVWRDRR